MANIYTDEGTFEYNTLTGSDPWESTKSLGRIIGTEAMMADPLTRAMGFEWGLPGARKARLSTKSGFRGKLARGYGETIGRFGMFINPIEAESLGAVGRSAAYIRGQGPIFEDPSFRFTQWMTKPMDAVNRWYLGDAVSNATQADVKSAYAVASKGLRPGASYKERKAHFKGVSDKPGRTLTHMSDKKLTKRRRNLLKGVADLELRDMTFRKAGKFVAVAGHAMTAVWLASIVGGIIKTAHDYGSASMQAKKQAPMLINTPTGGSLRMRAVQNAALSFGAMTAGIGNEAMSHHRY